MKKTLRLAVGVVGFYGVALVGTALFSSMLTAIPEAAAQVPPQGLSAPPNGYPAAAKAARGVVDDPVAKRRRPKLWTGRTRFDGLIHSVATHHEVDPALVIDATTSDPEPGRSRP